MHRNCVVIIPRSIRPSTSLRGATRSARLHFDLCFVLEQTKSCPPQRTRQRGSQQYNMAAAAVVSAAAKPGPAPEDLFADDMEVDIKMDAAL